MIDHYLEILFNSPLLTLFVLLGLGLMLGEIKIYGASLGSSGVIFVALLGGHLGCQIPDGVGQIGIVLFVYCVGIGAGARFFGALKREGSQLAKLALIIVVLGGLTTWGLAMIFQLPPELSAGIFAGALTSTPALAAAIESAGESMGDVVVGYGIAYPFGVIGVVLFVQLVPRLLKANLDVQSDDEDENPELKVERKLIETTNPNLFGKRLTDAMILELGNCLISRVWRNERMQPVHYEDTFQEGQLLLLVGTPKAVKIATEFMGKPSDREFFLDVENERQNLVVTNSELVGLTLSEIDPLKHHGVVITRINRMEFPFIPNPDTQLERRDMLTVVGPPEQLKAFESYVGHRSLAFSETSLISMAIGLALGIIAGRISIPMGGGESLSLGLAGGPLMVALLLGHFGKVGGVVGYIPRPTRMLLQEMGLVFFLADAGIKGGASMMDAVASEGISIFLIGALITMVPMVIGYLSARFLFKMSLLQSLGGVCGAMTSTPALGAIVANTTRQTPIVSYATVYPIAVILMAFFANTLIKLIH